MTADDEALEALWQMVAARTRTGADREAIDHAIWERFGADRAVVFTDLSGFSRRVAKFGIVHFLQVIAEQKRLLVPVVEQFGGRVVKFEADSLLITFPSAEAALRASIEMQRTSERHDRAHEPEDQLLLCLGVGFGRILVIGDADVYGQEVNAASKLGEDIATAGEILVTSAARDAVNDTMPDLHWEDLQQPAGGSDRNFRLRWSSKSED